MRLILIDRVAKLDKVFDFGSEDCRFESCHDRYPFLYKSTNILTVQITIHETFCFLKFFWRHLLTINRRKPFMQLEEELEFKAC